MEEDPPGGPDGKQTGSDPVPENSGMHEENRADYILRKDLSIPTGVLLTVMRGRC